jgi:peptidoglycan/xylan/chitin deacetylase (PgdA/CDA1 family)
MGFAYLTIDDAPSSDFQRKVAYLRARGVPAVFFCIGEQLERYRLDVIQAIRDGFLIGNHSYSHARFSQLSVDQAATEVATTDGIIDALYRDAGVERPAKLFRFPYADRGRQRRRFSRRLAAMGYEGLRIPSPRLPFPFVRALRFTGRDSWWTFDLRDWCLSNGDHRHPIRSKRDVLDRLDQEIQQTWGRIGRNHVFLMHDHEQTAELFSELVDRLLEHGTTFDLPDAARPRQLNA